MCAACLCLGLTLIWTIVPNPLWGVLSGYYRYDPRRQTPPAGLFLDRVEPSLVFFLDATLLACDGYYPNGQTQAVTSYEIEQVEYLGKSSYHAYALVHVRLTYADGSAPVAVFRLEAGHNESYMLESSVVNAGGWMQTRGLVVPDSPAPPGWATYNGGEVLGLSTCAEAGSPYGWDPDE